MSRLHTDDAVFTLTLRTWPLLSGKTSWTRPIGQRPRGAFSSTTRTESPIAKLRRGKYHFCLLWSTGKKSFIHLFQNALARHCAWRQRLLYLSWSVKTSRGRQLLDLRSNSLLGVNGSGSSGWSLRGVNGLSLRIFSTSHKRVDNASSLIRCSFSKAARIFCTDLIMRSQIPSWWLASGGLKNHWTSSFLSRLHTCFWSRRSNASLCF